MCCFPFLNTHFGIVFNSHIQPEEPLLFGEIFFGGNFCDEDSALQDKARLQELLDSMQEMRMRPGIRSNVMGI